ncbi:iron-containing alcohol dehydrogenase [Ferrimonas lipolytica]|uniref:Iron-containing alcohol dehydrogenase n=1 Tax=Ferrimonas lipolytica TaxID=2724191 RepID=A0A6H1UH27_9GAMM|nr:iron-containing alcohol dehydrogenase [Ferrimonas lipolytica]QIZ77623.1 iron-containing alcohol dehydrogenase [Ferrimonas lipolytica]
MKFTFENSTRVHFGEGQIKQVGNDIPKDKKVLVLFGGGSIKNNGVYDQVTAALADHQWGEFGGIEANPQYDTLMKAVELIRAEGYDYLLAVGGGSVVDGSKFVSAAVAFQGDPWDILAKGASTPTVMPIGCVLTLPATGSESNPASVVSRGNSKLAFFDPRVRPAFAVLDPQTTLSLSPRQVSNGVVDAFVHVIEQYLTVNHNAKVQDRFSEGLLLTLVEEGPKALTNPDDMEVRSNVMWAATMALNGLIGAGVPQDWTTHMIGHELTGHYGVDHGRSLTIMLPAVMKQRRDQKGDKIVQLGERVFDINSGSRDERIDATIEAVVAFFKQMEVPTTLADVELGDDAIVKVLASLAEHGREGMSEHGDVGPTELAQMLELAR